MSPLCSLRTRNKATQTPSSLSNMLREMLKSEQVLAGDEDAIQAFLNRALVDDDEQQQQQQAQPCGFAGLHTTSYRKNTKYLTIPYHTIKIFFRLRRKIEKKIN